MKKDVTRTEVIPVIVDGETRYAVMEVVKHKTGLGFVVYYGSQSQGGSTNDWKEDAEDQYNMFLMAHFLLGQIVSHAHPKGTSVQVGPAPEPPAKKATK
ncbi:MAG TPA: hypothetical protein VG122_06025 [Gemmata sp.]|nr:hypothetical protein [Gemmata sp.]